MKRNIVVAAALAATFASATAFGAKQVFYSEASEENPIRDTLDMRTGGFKGWGPMPNPTSPLSDRESYVQRDQDLLADRARHVAEVNAARERVWVANASLRAPYENVGSTRSGVVTRLVHFMQRGVDKQEIVDVK